MGVQAAARAGVGKYAAEAQAGGASGKRDEGQAVGA